LERSRSAAEALGSAFPHMIDKEQATKHLLNLAEDENWNVRGSAAEALGSAFPHMIDKEQARNTCLI